MWVYSLIWCRRVPFETLVMLTTMTRVHSTYRTSSVVTVPIPWFHTAAVVILFQSVRNYHYSLRNIPEERNSRLVGGLLAPQRRLSFVELVFLG